MVRGNRSHDHRPAEARRLFLLGAFGMMAGTVVQSVPSKPRSASDSKEPNRGQVPLLDFDRAYLSWRTKSASSQGRWRLIASAMSWSPHSGWSERTVLAPEVMAGDVFGSGRLPLNPPYRFQILASAHRHAILRDYGPAAPPRDSSAANLEVFSAMHFEEVTRQPRPVGTASLVPEGLSEVWPLTARIQAPALDGSTWLLEFPVDHLNHRDAGHAVEFQIETGPVLIPAVLVETTGVTVLDGFCLAYVFFNRLDRVDLALYGSAVPGGMPIRGYVGFGRIENAAIELHGGPNR
jgi:hypothetical protein